MKRLLTGFLIAAAASGCAVRTSQGVHFFLQRGVVLQLVHTCTDKARVYQAGPGFLQEIIGATPVDLALEPTVFGDRRISVTVQSIDTAGKVVGTYVEELYIDSNTTTAHTWIIGDTGWSGGGRQSRCNK